MRKNSIALFCLFITIAAGLLSCRDNDTTVSASGPHDRNSDRQIKSLRQAFLPLDNDNYWSYNDSLYRSKRFRIGSLTTRITGAEIDTLGRIIWSFEHSRDVAPLEQQMWQRNDSIFARQPCWEGYASLLRYFPLGNADSIRRGYWKSCDQLYGPALNYRSRQPYRTLAGNFDSCIYYEFPSSFPAPGVLGYVIFKPYVGIVGIEERFEPRVSYGRLIRRIALVRYTLSNAPDTAITSRDQHAIFPMAAGNVWEYADTTFSDTSDRVSGYGIHVNEPSFRDHDTVWGYNDPGWTESSGGIIERNDSVWGIRYTGSGFQKFLHYIPLNGADSLSYTVLSEDLTPATRTVSRLPGIFTTDAGSFSDCLVYSTSYPHKTEKIYYKPYLGMVGYEIRYAPLTSGGDSLRRGRLHSYRLSD